MMYTDRYGLAEAPFQLTPDARYWFESRTHKKAMAYLGYGLAQAEGFIVVTGEIGAGKSTLAAHLMRSIDAARLNAISIVSTQVEGDDMLRLTAGALGLAVRGVEKAALLDAVEDRLREERHAGRRTLLIVDEAQNLPHSALEELRMLSNFTADGRALVQVLLLGQPEFRDKLAEPSLEQLRQRVIATHHLDPMGEDEVGAYLTHRIAVAGGDAGGLSFTAEAAALLHRQSGGIPRKLNQLATRLLLFASIEERSVIGAEDVEAVIADMAADAVQPRADRVPAAAAPAPQERVLPLRSQQRPRLVDAETLPVDPDPMLVRRIVQLETQVQNQEAMLRRVLTLLVDWIEGDGARSNAA